MQAFFNLMLEAVEGGSQVPEGKRDPDKCASNTEDIILDFPADCCPDCCYARFPFCKGRESEFWIRWDAARKKSLHALEHKYFQTVVIIMIFISTLALVSHFVLF